MTDRQFRVVLTKGKIRESEIRRDEELSVENNEPWRAELAARERTVDCFYDLESVCMECHGHSSGPINHSEILLVVREHISEWLERSQHEVKDDDYYEIMCKPVSKRPKDWKDRIRYTKHRPLTRQSVYFRSAFPEVLDVDGFWKLLAELKGAKVDSTGGLWEPVVARQGREDK